MGELTFYEGCLIGAPLSLRFWCAHPNVIFQGGILLFAFVVIVSLFVGKKKGWKWGATLGLGGTAAVLVASVLIERIIIFLIWG